MTRVVSEPPCVGIVTPTLNAAGFLREAVDSVLSQDYPRVDYLVMDGGSTDGTRELLESYGERLRWVSAPDTGQADAVERGWRQVDGELLAFLNADDAYLPGAVGTAAEAFAHGLPGLLYGEGRLLDERGEPLDRYPTAGPDIEDFAASCPVCQPTAFVGRDGLERAGGLDAGLHFAFDYDLWIRLAQRSRVRRLDRELAVARMRRDNKTLGQRRKALDEAIAVVKRYFGYVSMAWLDGYSMHLVDGRDGFLEPHERSLRAHLLALGLGLRHNPRQVRRFWREWSVGSGLRADFISRWPDGWISRLHVGEHTVPPDATRLRVTGRHEAGMRAPLTLTIRAAGTTPARLELPQRGPFELALPCPPELRGRAARVTVEADRTWSPRRGGDFRRLSCLIDGIEFE